MTKKTKPREGGSEGGFGGILKGLGDLMEKLNEISESGQEFSKTGVIQGDGGQQKGIFGFTVKVGLGGDEAKVEPFGNIRKDAKTGRAVVQEVREPVVDVFEESDHVLVVLEMPGIGPSDVHLEAQDDLLTITATKGEKKYRKEVLLPGVFPKEKMQMTCNNGVLEIKCVH
jgi:HSP20 family protein